MLGFFAAWCAFWNLARGRKLFNITDSTMIARVVATLFMALAIPLLATDVPLYKSLATVLLTWVALSTWSIPAWNWSAAVGNDPDRSRVHGLGILALRMTLAAPSVIVLALFRGHPWNAFFAILTPLLALPYYFAGYLVTDRYVVPVAEIFTGAILGVLLFITAT